MKVSLDKEKLRELQKQINYKFENPALLEIALTHKSWSAENEGFEPNEKLEFLGDSVLGLIVTEHIYKTYTELAEGQLSLLRSVLVEKKSLAEVAENLSIGSYLKLGNKLEHSSVSPALLENAIEAIIGAIYLDGGWSKAQEFVLNVLESKIKEYSSRNNEDFKSRLKVIFEQKFRTSPTYRITTEGPAHEKRFYAQVLINDEIAGEGDGRSKKEAEQSAAGQALKRFANE